jgi:hypothetical protein
MHLDLYADSDGSFLFFVHSHGVNPIHAPAVD